MSEIDLNLLPDYLVEAEEHLEEMENLLLQLAGDPANTEILHEIFRPIHSIKGAAQFIGLERSSKLAHRLEDLLDLLRNGERPSSAATVELLIDARDRIVNLVNELEATQMEQSTVEDVVALITAEIDGGDTGGGAVEVSSDAEQGKDNLAEQIEYSADTQSPAVSGGEVYSDYYHEENDQELFGIFIDNLREGLDLLRTRSSELAASADKVVLLERCVESLEGLRSAANYMGYEELVRIYDNWLEDIVDVQDMLGCGSEFPVNFMDDYIAEVQELFPQISSTVAPLSEQPSSEQPAPAQPSASEHGVAVQAQEAAAVDIDMALLPDYLVEAQEHLEEMETLLLQLADDPHNTAVMHEIFRPIHSIKGAAQFIGLQRSSRLAHRLEDLLDLLRNGERASSVETVELLISARDRIVNLAEELEKNQREETAVDDMVALITDEIDGKGSSGSIEQQHPDEAAALTDKLDAEPAGAGSDQAGQLAMYQEENDQELFGIFIENLREKIDLVRLQASELEGSTDKVVLLERCADCVESLRSAANYMGYDDLVLIYTNWLEDIGDVQQAVNTGNAVPAGFMDGYISEVISLFPRIQLQQADNVPASVDTDAPADVAASDEQRLFDKLSDALDSATSKQVEPEYELLHGVFEEMISDREQAGPEQSDASVQSRKSWQAAGAHAESSQPEAAKPGEVSKQDSKLKARKAQTGGASKDDRSGVKAGNKAAEKVSAEAKGNGKDKPEAGKADKKAAARKTDESVLKKSVRVDADKIDTLINQVGELVVDRAYFFQLFDDMRGLQQYFKDELGIDQKELKQIRNFTYRMGEAIASLSRTSNELQEGVMKVRMLPISALFNRYPRLVHDLTRNNGKKVNLQVEGEDTELDKMVVEKLSDPLIHIIRNAVDHGLETVEHRKAAGKSDAGTLYLKSYHESNQVVVEIIDDGRGIDPKRVKAKAIEKGVVTEHEANRLTEMEIIRLITLAGFSTTEQITDTSGRGVGMDVVRKNIEKLNGTLDIESIPGQGTSIRLKIPLTLAIIHAHLVRVSGNMYTIPLANIEETLRIGRDEATIIEGTEVIYLRGKTLPIIHLSKLFNSTSFAEDRENIFVVVVNTGTQKIGLVVDELLGQEEVVIKPLVEYLRDKSGFSGATIIGDGSISLILDIYEIANMTVNQQIKRQRDLTMNRNNNETPAPIPGQMTGQVSGHPGV